MSDQPGSAMPENAATVQQSQFENPGTVLRPLLLRFTASGSEYFRIWIVNLLLIVVTLGFYLPFAKARRLRYFYANTLVDGQPLAFHGDPWKMFRGYLVMLVLFGAYAASSYVSEIVAFGAFVVLTLLWPALWRSSLMFRLGNTSWRGLRFAFEGSVGGAYRAMLPLFVPALLVLATSAWFMSGVDKKDPVAVMSAQDASGPAIIVSFLLGLVLVPLAMWMLKRYQHGGYRYGQQAAYMDASRWSFYKLFLKVGLLAVGCIIIIFLFLFVALPALKAMGFGRGGANIGLVISFGLVVGLFYLFMVVALGASGAAWMQNLSWSSTRSQHLRFHSAVGAGALSVLSLKNALLIAVTLGMYRPFAVVNTMRMRLQAVEVESGADVDSWVSASQTRMADAKGEMSGDFFGIDVGL